ncbi:hypothetical protein [uncultured Microbacterium sp.]|uniref:hypothetical protein n=1 Tax=uncultured Microbacterium sp. TaxID=191216 RepID=UPI0035CBDC6D
MPSTVKKPNAVKKPNTANKPLPAPKPAIKKPAIKKPGPAPRSAASQKPTTKKPAPRSRPAPAQQPVTKKPAPMPPSVSPVDVAPPVAATAPAATAAPMVLPPPKPSVVVVTAAADRQARAQKLAAEQAPAISPAPRRPTPAKTASVKPSWFAKNRGTLLSLIPVYVLVVLLGVSAAVALQGPRAPEPEIARTAPETGLIASEDAAQTWLIDNAAPTQPLIIDDRMSALLVAAGWSADDLFVYATASDAVSFEEPTNWRDAAFVVTTPATAAAAADAPQVSQAIDNSTLVASFGTGADLVQVRMVTPEGASLAAAETRSAAATRAQFGAQLAENAEVRLSDVDRASLSNGIVDERIAAVLGTLAATGDVTVTSFPVIVGEADRPLRQVAISDVGGTPLVKDGAVTPEASALLDGLQGTYAPQDITVDGESVVLRYSVAPAID